MTSPNRLSSLKKEMWSSDFSTYVLTLRSRLSRPTAKLLFRDYASVLKGAMGQQDHSPGTGDVVQQGYLQLAPHSNEKEI